MSDEKGLSPEELIRGLVQATLELACLRNNLCFEDSPPMVVEEVSTIVQDTFDALYGIATCSEEPCEEVLRIRAALAAPAHSSSVSIPARGRDNPGDRIITPEMVAKADKETGSTHMSDHQTWSALMAEKLGSEDLVTCARCNEMKECLLIETGFAGENEPLCANCISEERRQAEAANGDSATRSTPQSGLPQPAAPAESQAVAGVRLPETEQQANEEREDLRLQKHCSTPTEVPLASKSKEELVRIIERMSEEMQWYVDERNRLLPATPPRSPAQEGFSADTPQGGQQPGYRVKESEHE